MIYISSVLVNMTRFEIGVIWGGGIFNSQADERSWFEEYK